MMSLISELKRRNVFRVAWLYVLSSWLVAQLAAMGFAGGELDWVYRFCCALLIICFPLLLVFSWIYEITPEGIRKEYEVARAHSITLRTGRRLALASRVVLVVAAAVQIGRWLLV